MLIRILVAVEAAVLRDRLVGLLEQDGFLVSSCDHGSFWRSPERESFDLAVAERANLPVDIKEAITRVRELPEAPEVILLRETEDVGDTATLQAAGCFAVVRQNLSDRQLRETLGMLAQRRREGAVDRIRAERAEPVRRFRDAVSKSPLTRRLLKLAARVAASDTSLLVLGETGVGKEWLARAVHAEGPRAEGPFISVNCGAIPENLLESELYGHEKGAFTGAVKSRRGHFELAHGGTIFLDEVAEMAPHLQVKLLRALQDRTIQRVGAEKPVAVDVRVIAATNRDLVEALKAKEFRQDLYYRLAVVTLTVPPLRERLEDLPALADPFLEESVIKLGRYEVKGFTLAATAALAAYDWPGNIRELINVVERAVLLCDGEVVDLADLPEEFSVGTPQVGSAMGLAGRLEAWLDRPLEEGRQRVMRDFERAYLDRHLERSLGNVGAASRAAGVDPRTLYNKMKLYGLRKEDYRRASGRSARRSG